MARARLESLRAAPGVQFALSAEQLDHYTTAHQFLQELYMELRLSLPETCSPFVYDHRFTETAGICDTLLRAPGIQYSSDHVRSREGYVAGWAHELIHASGSVRSGGVRSPASDSRWRFPVTRAGWTMRLGGSALFSALEEYMATVNRCMYLSEVRGLTSTVAEEGAPCPFIFSGRLQFGRFSCVLSSSIPGALPRSRRHLILGAGRAIQSLLSRYR